MTVIVIFFLLIHQYIYLLPSSSSCIQNITVYKWNNFMTMCYPYSTNSRHLVSNTFYAQNRTKRIQDKVTAKLYHRTHPLFNLNSAYYVWTLLRHSLGCCFVLWFLWYSLTKPQGIIWHKDAPQSVRTPHLLYKCDTLSHILNVIWTSTLYATSEWEPSYRECT